MPLLPLLNALQDTHWASSLKESTLLFPLVEGTHILSLSISVAMIVMFDLRLLRVSFRNQPVALMMDQLMRCALPGFCVMVCTGALLFSTEAVRAYGNPFFRAKILMLILAGINALYFRFRYQPRLAEWDLATTPMGARVVAALSLLFWVGVITCGRTMAYEL